MLSPRIGGWGAEGGGDLTSIVIPHPWFMYHPLFLSQSRILKKLRGFFLVLVVFIYSLIQNRRYEIVGHFTVFVPYPPFVGAEDLIS